MKSPFLSNNPRIDAETLLARLRAEMGRPAERAVSYAPTPGSEALASAGAQPRTRAFSRLTSGFVGKALRWGKSFLLLQRTRFRVHLVEDAQKDLLAQFKAREAALQAANDALRQDIAAISRRHDLWSMEIAFQQSRLSRAMARLQEAPAAGATPPAPATEPDDLDALYLSFEDAFRGTRDDIKGRVAHHIEKFSLAGAGQPGRPILDLGCGRGEWLEVLREHGLAARGIDLNSCNIELCRRLDLDVERIDALSALRACPDGSLGGVSAFHLVEHLPFEAMVALIDEALRALAEGGILLLETPNPESLMVTGRNFFFDPTHRHPIPPQVLGFVLERRGFASVTIDRIHPYGREYYLDASQGQAEGLLNELLFGPQDYAAIGRKP